VPVGPTPMIKLVFGENLFQGFLINKSFEEYLAACSYL
jgi:hypothetical protein